MKVNCTVKINAKKNINELPGVWTKEDYQNILELTGFSDDVQDSELKEMVMMAIADEEPEESAALLLKYRLGEQLNEGQIQQLSHDMQEDKESEEYPDIFLQKEMFNVNQLLFKSYNGRFPNCHAIYVDLEMKVTPAGLMKDENYQNEIIVKALVPALGEHSGVVRLYEDEIGGKIKFTDVDGIIWQTNIKKQEDGTYEIRVFSSEYWFNDIPSGGEYETSIKLFEPEEDDD